MGFRGQLYSKLSFLEDRKIVRINETLGISKFPFEEGYRQIFSRQFSFNMTREPGHKMIFLTVYPKICLIDVTDGLNFLT